jgi:hypothetical protein
MKLRSATLIALIGQIIYILCIIIVNVGLLQWNQSLSLIMTIIGMGSMIVFLTVLYLKQKS